MPKPTAAPQPRLVVLGSSSPARLLTLQQAGIEPLIVVPDVDEQTVHRPGAPEMTAELARLKGESVLRKIEASGEFEAPFVLLACDSMLEIEGRVYGKPGKGAGVEFNIKEGPITMLSLGVTAEGKFKFVIAEGESVRGPIPPTGNTNTHGRFAPEVRTFLKRWVAEGPTHHFALGIGHRADEIEKVAKALGIESVVVT